MMYKVLSIGSRTDAELGSQTHFHQYWEFVYYLDGYGTVASGNDEYVFHPNFFIAHPPNTPHSETMDGKFSNIYILADIGDALPFHTFDYKDRDMHEMENIFIQLRFHFTRKKSNWKEIDHALLALMIQLLLSRPCTDTTDECVDTAVAIIVKGISDKKFNIKEVYDSIPMSKMYFSSLFKRITGFTPLQYLVEKRMENAKNLLMQSDNAQHTVGEIADLCGYDDIYYFSRVFKKTVGLSPTEWRRQEMNKNNSTQ